MRLEGYRCFWLDLQDRWIVVVKGTIYSAGETAQEAWRNAVDKRYPDGFPT